MLHFLYKCPPKNEGENVKSRNISHNNMENLFGFTMENKKKFDKNDINSL